MSELLDFDIAARMPKHVRVCLEREAGLLASPLDKLCEAARRERRISFRHEHEFGVRRRHASRIGVRQQEKKPGLRKPGSIPTDPRVPWRADDGRRPLNRPDPSRRIPISFQLFAGEWL